MATLKYKLGDGWKLLYEDIFKKVINICSQAVRRDKNLADLDNIAEARANLGIDGSYLNKTGDTMTGALNLPANTWNGIGNNAYLGDKNISGAVAIRSKTSADTGLALVKNSSSDGTDRALLKYSAMPTVPTSFKVDAVQLDKPFYAGGGFISETVNEADLNSYHKVGFFTGNANTSVNILPDSMGTNDYSGISIGRFSDGNGANPELGQIVFDGTRMYFRDWDVESQWSAWKEFAFKTDVDSSLGSYAKKDASNITVANWASKLGTGQVVSGNTNLVTGGTVFAKINSAQSSIADQAVNSAKQYVNSQLSGYAKTNASNINAADWAANLGGQGNIAPSNNGLVSGAKIYNYIENVKTTLTGSINTKVSEALAGSDAIAQVRSQPAGYMKLNSNVIIQWGNGVQANANNWQGDITFPISMSAVYSVVSNDSYNGDASYLGTSVVNLIQGSNNTYTGFRMRTASYGGNRYYWIAIGKV